MAETSVGFLDESANAGRVGPVALRVACLLWLTAVAAGVVEAAIQVTQVLADTGPSAGVAMSLAIRALVYTAVVAVVAFLWHGRRWARVLLAVGLGGVGVLSLVIEPIRWLAAGGDPAIMLSTADATFAAIAVTRGIHLAAVLVALVLMFTPSVNGYLRRDR